MDKQGTLLRSMKYTQLEAVAGDLKTYFKFIFKMWFEFPHLLVFSPFFFFYLITFHVKIGYFFLPQRYSCNLNLEMKSLWKLAPA